MDSVTHIVLGACVGEVLMDKKAGKKALLWGALAQSIPDIDFINGAWMPLTKELIAHRGITHSLLFALIISFFLALVANLWHKKDSISISKWFSFFLIEVLIHLILDSLNNYGTRWFEPFSSQRIAFNVIYVADPLFTITPLVVFFLLWVTKMDHQHRMKMAAIGIVVPVFYLCFALVNKIKMQRAVARHITASTNYFTAPTLLNNFLWTAVIQDSTGFQVGYKSILSKEDFVFTRFEQNQSYLDSIHDHQEVMDLKLFSQGYYTLEKWNDTLVFNDLRFGQINGWENPTSKFAFHYYLSHPADNDLVVQRGRFAGLNVQSSKVLLIKMFDVK
jgi:inner membrane protein